MCGIVAGVADRNIVPILIEGLRRLEYRGYDSAGIAVIDEGGHLQRLRTVGKVHALEQALEQLPLQGRIGIAHTRWATHGVPSERNAHPHLSRDGLAIVHNGIIENYEELREELRRAGYQFSSETDTEVVAHRIHFHMEKLSDLFKAVRATVAELEGAYALVVVSEQDPERLIAARVGCPVVLGLGLGENFVASDAAALLPVTRRFMFLDEGDVAEIRRGGVRVIDREGNNAERPVRESELSADAAEKGQYRHFMLKEIHEQPRAVANTLQERVANGRLLEAAFGPAATAIFDRVEAVHIVACGTSYHAGVVARYLIEQICRIPCRVEIASEYRYRNPVVTKNSLFVVISQSGETADTLAALRMARLNGYLSTLAICNAPESSLVRESELVMLTRAGPEIGVASTKAFTTQLDRAGDADHRARASQRLGSGARARPGHAPDRAASAAGEDPRARSGGAPAGPALRRQAACAVPRPRHDARDRDGRRAQAQGNLLHPRRGLRRRGAQARSARTGRRRHAGRGRRAEQRPAREAQVQPDGSARAGRRAVRVRRSGRRACESSDGVHVIQMPKHVADFQAPVVYTIPLQLLAYHVAILKGTDVDQPRNLAKSVTVE